MKKILLLLITACFYFQIDAQLVVDNSLTPQQLVQNILAGSGVTISNVTFNGDALQIGQFGGNSNVGFNNGIILSTGFVNSAIGPNDHINASDMAAGLDDLDLDLILAPDSSLDASILEFDFIPVSDTIKFNYVFASEEYLEFVNSYNDVFGFFISGPGINGPFTNNAINIAIIPGSTAPVSIANINDVDNSSFYVDNGDGLTPPFNNDPLVIRYDGLTVPLQAISAVQCGESYHLKLVIADANDQSYDSGVFLEAGSLSSSGVNIDLTTVTGDSIIYEECTLAQFVFSRPISQISDTSIIHYTLTGSATEGIDYTQMIDSVIFFPNEDTVVISLQAFQDGVLEGNESVIITAVFVSECGDTVIVSKGLTISEQPIFDANVNAPLVFCPNDSVPMIVEAIGGTPPYIYTWSNGEVGDTVPGSINGVGTQTYTVNIVDFCGFTFQSGVTITQSEPPAINLTLSSQPATCIDDSVFMSANATGGVQPLIINWSNGQTGPFVFGQTSGLPTYYVTITDECNNILLDSITIQAAPNPVLVMNSPDITIFCPDNQVTLSATASNGFQPYTYLWSTNETTSSIDVGIANNGSQSYTVTATDFCGNQISDSVKLTLNRTLKIDSLNSSPSSDCLNTGLVNSFLSGANGTVNYTWTGPGSTGPTVGTTQTINNLATGWYYLHITDNVCFYDDSIFVDILDPVVASFTSSSTIGSLPVSIDFFNQSQNADSFHWDFGNGLTNDVSNLSTQTSLYTSINSFTVTLTAFQQGCSDVAVMIINIISEPSIHEPNIFTPNGDTINPNFTLNPVNFATFDYSIFNRWGNLMFQGDLTTPNWNGMIDNKEAEEAVYFYKYSGVGINGESKTGQGFFQLKK